MSILGIWSDRDGEGEDVNACARSGQGQHALLAVGDDRGRVKVGTTLQKGFANEPLAFRDGLAMTQ